MPADDQNNNIFNEDKFMVLRYGRNVSLKEDSLYFSPDMYSVIEEVSDCRDLGVRLQNDCKFNINIQNIIKKCAKLLAGS